LSQYTQEAAIESVDGGYVPAASVNVAEGGRAARAVPSLVGFADGRSEGDAIDFGWVIAGTELTDPVQKSQLVLVSVPGFLDELELTITTGWLDGDANEVRVNPPFPVTVRLPPDFEVFDTLAGQGGIRPGPAIFDHYVDQSITVRACAQAEIVVPGARLWRSTSVTLGGQAANKITVLPNMQGIIATFTDLKPPSIFAEEPDPEIEQATQPSDDENRVYTTNLTVWTSEGTASLNRNVRVAVPKSGRCEIGTASPEAGPTVPVIAETQAAPSP